jgi:hypothetical protein
MIALTEEEQEKFKKAIKELTQNHRRSLVYGLD